MKRIIISSAILFLSTCLCLVTAQSLSLNGKVVDQQSNPISNVKVTLEKVGISTFTDTQGEFTITNVGVESRSSQPEVYFNGTAIFLNSKGEHTIICIYEYSGRLVEQIIPSKLKSGTYKFYPSAYLPDAKIGLYIVTIYAGNKLYSFKILNNGKNQIEKGLIYLNTDHVQPDSHSTILKSAEFSEGYREVDKLIFEHDSYQRKEVTLSSYTQNCGTIALNDQLVTPNPPSNLSAEARDPETILLKWIDNSDSETGFEIWREKTEGSGIYDIVATTNPNTTRYYDKNLNSTSLGYMVRAISGHLASHWTASAFAPAKMRVINDLYNQTDGYGNDWSKLNNIVRVRVGKTQQDVENNTDLERLEPKDATYSYDVDYIMPAYNNSLSSSNYEDFDVSTYGYGAITTFLYNVVGGNMMQFLDDGSREFHKYYAVMETAVVINTVLLLLQIIKQDIW